MRNMRRLPRSEQPISVVLWFVSAFVFRFFVCFLKCLKSTKCSAN